MSSPLLYLRGVHSQEVESILQFVYLGKATFYRDRINEFLNVAKSLEIKEIGKDNLLNDQLNLEYEPEFRQTNNFVATPTETDHSIATFNGDQVNEFLNVANSLEEKEIGKDNSKNEQLDLHDEPESKQTNKFIVTSNETDYSIDSKKDKANQFVSKASTHIDPKDKIISNVGDIQLSCEQCNYKSKNYNKKYKKKNLVRHIKMNHEEKKFNCNQCNFTTAEQRYLDRHIQSIHEQIRYSCNQCNLKAKQKDYLQLHILTIHDGFKYTCEYCDFKTSSKGSLYRHVKSIHENRKYPCVQCSYKATCESSLNRHKDSAHRGIRHLCDQCNYSATFQSALKRHVKSIHKDSNTHFLKQDLPPSS